MRERVSIAVLIVVISTLAFFPERVEAQATWGTINGYVTDPAGAAVPNATATITNADTGVERTVTTNAQGLFNAPNLDPGNYKLTVQATGFSMTTSDGIVLRVDSTVRMDVKLSVGSVSQNVTVSAAADMLKTEKTDVGNTLSEKTIESTPVINNNISRLYLTVPGVLQNFFQIGNSENPSEFQQTTVNGQFFNVSDYMIDGVEDIAYGFSGFQVIVPPQESVQEMKINTADYDPEIGSSAGMVTQIVTKSGSNSLHGSAFWNNRNSDTFAANPFTEKIPGTGPNGTGTGVAPFNQNIGGVSLGGPIKRNKMFLFGDYQLLRRISKGNVLQTVPNDAFRNGDFSAVAATNPIFDPLTGNADGSGRTQFFATSGAGADYNPACVSAAPCLNMIPIIRFSPVATNLLALLPPANLNQSTSLNRLDQGSAPFSTDEIDARYDWNISDTNKFFARYSYMWSFLDNLPVWGTVAGGQSGAGLGAQAPSTQNTNVALNYTHIFNSSLLTEVRGGLSRFKLRSYQPDSALNTSTQVGIPGINLGGSLYGGLPEIDGGGPVSGGWFLGVAGAVPRLDTNTTFQGVNNWTWLRGNHQLRWGADVRRTREDFFGDNTRGDFNMCEGVTASADSLGSGLGDATFLLGLPCSYTRAHVDRFPKERETRASFYGQDVWKITQKLTANYGLRWDYFEPDVSGYGKGGLANFDFATGQIIVAGYGNISKYADVEPQYHNFAPRLGLAYKLTEKSVLRAGFGQDFYTSPYQGNMNQLVIMYPVSAYQTINQATQYQPIFPLSQGPPAPPAVVIPASGRITPTPDLSLRARAFDYKVPSLPSWNVTLEQQLTPTVNVSMAYVGNVGRHVARPVNDNSAPAGAGDLVSRRPYYQEFGISQAITDYRNDDTSNYNALEIVGTKRFSNGFSFGSSFTWAKALNDQLLGGNNGDQSIDPYDRKGTYGVDPYNREFSWVTTHSIQIPYGRGLRFGAGATGLRQVLFGGWEFDGVTTLQTGFHFSPILDSNSTLNADWSQRPDRLPGVDLYASAHTRGRWFNVSAFAPPPACCVWGNAHRGIMVGPGYNDEDWGFSKLFSFRTPLNESTSLEFRAEALNIFNKTNLGLPNNAVDSPTAGVISSLTDPSIVGRGDRMLQFNLHLRW